MVSLTLLSTVLMGLLVVATFVAVARVGKRRVPPREREAATRTDAVANRIDELVRTPAVWTIAFVVLVLAVGLGAVAAVGDVGLSPEIADVLYSAVIGLVGLLLGGFIFFGVYFGARNRGLGNAHGVAAGSLALGFAFLLVIAAQLTVGVIG